MKPPAPLTRREREIMDILYRRGRATAHEVLEDLSEPPAAQIERHTARIEKDPDDADAYHHRAHAMFSLARSSSAGIGSLP